jgi:hypothetical protein
MSTKQGLVTLIPIKTFLCGAVGGAVAVLVAGAAALFCLVRRKQRRLMPRRRCYRVGDVM